MEKDLAKIKKISEKKEYENIEFRSFLKMIDTDEIDVDSLVHDLYDKISSQIDCKSCANCCKEIGPILLKEDIHRLSEELGLTNNQFIEKYLIKDEDGDFVFNKMPCPFLKDNLCTYYSNRPEDCRSYPHLQKKDFISRLFGVVSGCSVCPIVFNVYEELKAQLWH